MQLEVYRIMDGVVTVALTFISFPFMLLEHWLNLMQWMGSRFITAQKKVLHPMQN